ncbi:MAG: TrmB family transcriptional regulator [Candidatus Zixiibacteriota bacterium]|nr:MAG: TrmB family transcriptional regulator [candidate division Zixibacteria bacterium]
MAVDNNRLLERLVDLGLSEREAKVYLALLSKRSACSADLQKSSGIPQTKVYEIIRRLVRQGYCRERRVGHKRSFEAIDPQTALNFHVQKLEVRLEDASSLKRELTEIFNAGGEVMEPLEYIEILHGKESIHHHYCQLLRNAKREIMGFARPPYTCDTTEKEEEQARENEALVARGGLSLWVYELDDQADASHLSLAEFFHRRGERIRVAQRLPLKMMVFDGREVLVTQQDPYALTGELTMSIIKQNTVANAYRALFEFFWNQAEEYESWKRRRNLVVP